MNKWQELFKIAFRNIFRSKRRSFFSMFAVLICVLFIVGMNSMFEGEFDDKASVMQRLFLGELEVSSNEFVEENDDYSIQYPLDIEGGVDEFLKSLDSREDIAAALPRISTGIRLDNLHKKSGVLWGIDIDKEVTYHNFTPTLGRLPTGKKEIGIGTPLLEKLNLNIGDSLLFKFRSYDGFEKYYKGKIVGSFDFGYEAFDSNYIIMPYRILHSLTGYSENQTQKIHLYTTSGDLKKLKRDLQVYSDSFNIKSWLEDPFVFAFESFKVWRLNISLSFVIVAAFLLVLTILMVIKERKKEIGILSAMGMSRREIVTLFFYEGVIISLIGGAIGTIFMFVWLYIFRDNPLTFTSINPETGLKVINSMNFRFSIKGLLWGFIFVTGASSLILIIPSLKAATIKPIDAIRGE